MRTLDINETIELTDGNFQYVESVNSIIRLRNLADGQYRDLHLAEVTQRMVGLASYAGVSPRSLETMPARQVSATLELNDHVQEILTGTRPGGTEPDPRYDLATTTQNQRIENKIVELRPTNFAVSRRTLMRKIKSFRENGRAGLIDRRSLRQTAPLDHLDPQVQEALCEVLASLVDRSTGTKSRIIFETRMLLIKTLGGDAPPMPSDSSMYRYIDTLTIGSHATGSAKTRRSLADRPTGTFATRSENLPGGEMQIDSTTLDMMVKVRNVAMRPILTILLDRATRSIVAYTFRLDATKGIDHAALLAQALTPAQNRPDKSAWRESLQRKTPQLTFLKPEERHDLERNRPFIFPRTIVTDNGSDYVGHVFQAAAEKFGINLVLSAPHTPTGKPLVERNFHSIGTLFTQYLPGYVGNSPENRGRDVKKEDLISIHALAEYFDDWVLKVWNNRPHGGLRDRLEPTIKLSPNQKFAEASQVTAALILPLTTEDYIDLMPSSYRVISRVGINIGNRQYDSSELHPYRDQKSNIPGQNGKWEVKTDPNNPYLAWVQSREKTWIELALRTQDYDLMPHLEQSIISDRQVQRNEVAAINSASFGTLVHSLPPENTSATGPDIDSGDDDNDFDLDSEMLTFDPNKD